MENPWTSEKNHPQNTSQKRQKQTITVHGGEVIIPCVKAGPSHPRSALDGPDGFWFSAYFRCPETGSYHKP